MRRLATCLTAGIFLAALAAPAPAQGPGSAGGAATSPSQRPAAPGTISPSQQPVPPGGTVGATEAPVPPGANVNATERPVSPGMTTPTPTDAATARPGTVSGVITGIDPMRGTMRVRTDQGDFDVPIPSGGLQGLNTGDRLDLELGVRASGAGTTGATGTPSVGSPGSGTAPGGAIRDLPGTGPRPTPPGSLPNPPEGPLTGGQVIPRR
jgi:hypothetical protein